MIPAKPTLQQMEWANQEIGVLIHYIMEIYNPDFKETKTPAVRTELAPSRINPNNLSPEQWVRSAAELGAKYAILVTNHGTGFSLWPTKENDYSCASLAWKDGKGDILRDFIDACKKYGLKPGIYYNTLNNGYYGINGSVKYDYHSPEYQSYVRMVERQLKELWTEYGDFFEIWFDGGLIPVEEGGPDVVPLLRKYQPNAVAFQGPKEHPHNLRWVGNEYGYAPEECWGALNPDDDSNLSGTPNGSVWIPAETDFPNRSNDAFEGGWGWKAGEENLVFSPEHLLDCYINSVGRNSNMLVGMAISTDGDFQDEEQFIAFGKLLKKTFGTPLIQLKNTEGEMVELKNPEKKKLNYLTLCEDISLGHSILDFTVFADGKECFSGNCIGHKRIIRLHGICPDTVTVKINRSVFKPALQSISIF